MTDRGVRAMVTDRGTSARETGVRVKVRDQCVSDIVPGQRK